MASEKTAKNESSAGAEGRTPRIIVSFTSIPSRIGTITQVLDSLYEQSLKPDRILLWLAEEQFPEKESGLPEKLLSDVAEKKFELRWCDDLGSHKKYYYAMQEFPEDIVIIVDDDMVYHRDTVKALYELHCSFPNTVTCIWAKLIIFGERGESLPYKDWIFSINLPVPSMQVIPMGGGGVLYPPHVLDEKVFDREALIQYSSFGSRILSDDIWLKVHSVLAEAPAVVQPDRAIRHRTIKGTQENSIGNTFKSKNDNYIEVFSHIVSTSGHKNIKEVFREAKERGDYFDVNSPIVRERTYERCLEMLDNRLALIEAKGSGRVRAQFCHDVLSWFNLAMTHGDEELTERYRPMLKGRFLAIPNIENLSRNSIHIRALIECDAVLLEEFIHYHGHFKGYMQMLKNWEGFFEDNPACGVPYRQSYVRFLARMHSFSESMESPNYSPDQIAACKKALKNARGRLPLSQRIAFAMEAHSHR